MRPLALEALWLSLQVALLALALSAPLAIALAAWMARTRWPGRLLLDTLILLPLGLPPAVTGFVLLLGLQPDAPLGFWLERHLGWRPGIYPVGAALAATLMTLPLMVRMLRPAFEACDPLLIPVARTLGASAWRAWWTISLPLARPAVIAALALGLAVAWGESGATLVLAAALAPPHGATVPVALLQALQQHPQGNEAAWELAGVSLGVAIVAVLISEWGRQHWRRLRPPLSPRGRAS
ncbi:MAG TPA: ABC transporter permease subunit [Aquabacterium sp.]|nr:ABC transporter permease subunit [Aquabacterium sp.]